MNQINKVFAEKLAVINIGTSIFKDDLQMQNTGVIQLDWKPPAGGNPALIKALEQLEQNEKVEQANARALEIITSARPVLVDIEQAINAIPGMTKYTILHSGRPPVTWEAMCEPMRGAVTGALIYEGLAHDEQSALEVIGSGKITFAPCNEYGAVGPMAGIISASMPLHIIENKTHGNFSYCSLNEGLGKVLRFGAFGEDVINRLKWIETELAPALKAAVKLAGGIDLRNLTAQAMQMGDECHNRCKAASSLFVRQIVPYLARIKLPAAVAARILDFLYANDHFALNLSMPACKAALDAAHGIENSTIVTTMARNGVEFGIRVSGCSGNTWFTGPAQMIQGLMFPGYTMADANPDIGDSAITETMGIGGFAMGGAPAIVQFVGGTVADALNYTQQMYEITTGENSNYSIPNLNFRGTPTAIDVRKVIEKGILPIINTGMAHKLAGIGQVGAGVVRPPMKSFEKAIMALAKNGEKHE